MQAEQSLLESCLITARFPRKCRADHKRGGADHDTPITMTRRTMTPTTTRTVTLAPAMLLCLAYYRACAEAKVTPSAPPECTPADLPMSKARGGGAQILGPAKLDAASVSDWLARMKSMRTACQRAIGFNGSASRIPELKWTQTAYISPQARARAIQHSQQS